MDLEIIAAIITGVVACAATIILQVMSRQRRLQLRMEGVTRPKVPSPDEILSQVMKRLETSVGIEAISTERMGELENRLAKVEGTIQPLTTRDPKVTSIEYQFMMSEIDRVVRDLKADLTQQQREEEAKLEQRLSLLSRIFTISLTIIGIILTISLPTLFYLLSRGG